MIHCVNNRRLTEQKNCFFSKVTNPFEYLETIKINTLIFTILQVVCTSFYNGIGVSFYGTGSEKI